MSSLKDKGLDTPGPMEIFRQSSDSSGPKPVLGPGGGVSEWFKELVLKTSDLHGSVGSNPTPTAIPRVKPRETCSSLLF